MRVLVIGDSHTNAFMDKSSTVTGGFILQGNAWTKHCSKDLLMNRIGPVLAYNILKYNLIEQLNNVGANFNDAIILSFGEIDCRAHLRKRIKDDFSNAQEIVDACVNNYMIGIEMVRKITSNVYAWCATPPRSDEPFRAEFPYYGTYEERVKLVKMFNSKMKELLGDRFLSIEDILLTNDKANPQYYLDFIHVHPLKVQPFVDRELSKIK